MPIDKTKDPIELERSDVTMHEKIYGAPPPRECSCFCCRFPKAPKLDHKNPDEKFDSKP